MWYEIDHAWNAVEMMFVSSAMIVAISFDLVLLYHVKLRVARTVNDFLNGWPKTIEGLGHGSFCLFIEMGNGLTGWGPLSILSPGSGPGSAGLSLRRLVSESTMAPVPTLAAIRLRCVACRHTHVYSLRRGMNRCGHDGESCILRSCYIMS